MPPPATASKTLAIEGGEKLRGSPFPARFLFGEEEKAAAMAIFDSALETGGAPGYALYLLPLPPTPAVLSAALCCLQSRRSLR
eukprot:SAG31_NODE_7690_length_1616_cov_1.780488_2_plen_83_part_00